MEFDRDVGAADAEKDHVLEESERLGAIPMVFVFPVEPTGLGLVEGGMLKRASESLMAVSDRGERATDPGVMWGSSSTVFIPPFQGLPGSNSVTRSLMLA